MNCVRFILDSELVELENPDPTRTVLQYLREDLHRVGSKEGCAEGDCGSCTVVIGELVSNQGNERIQFRSVNACIQFLPTLDGKMLFAVESLKTAQGQLHPVQQSLVDCHASQCGFCTPGFVMSMFALYKTNANINREAVEDALSGNLCRCTGYRPIIDACLSMIHYPVAENSNPLLFESAHNRSTNISDLEQQAIDQLHQLKRSDKLTLKIENRSYHAPVCLDELAQIVAGSPNARILAGGTDIGLWVTKQLRELDDIIYLGNVDELNRIEQTDASSGQSISIGAAVSLTDAFNALSEHYPELNQLFRRFSSVPVRNAGTLVGNIANGSPIGDSMPALICMGARLVLRQGQQSREVDLQDFYLDYQKNILQSGEFIQVVLFPVKDRNWQLRSYKLSKRFDQDISAVCAAFSIRLEDDKVADIRIAFGGMAAIPKRATQTEALLKGQLWDEGTVHQAMATLSEDFKPLSDMRASQNYRQQSAANLLYRFYLETRRDTPLTHEQLDVFAVQR